jgi:pectate lyase
MQLPTCLKISIVIILIVVEHMFVVSSTAQASPAFPTAEGYGAISIGGRGGRVIKVTNLNSDGPGSLQAATSANGPRIVVFEVGGVIRGDIEIKHSNITIAGQTAPSPGITIVGRLFARPENDERLHDIIIRFLRFRPPPTTGVNGDTVQLPNTERVVLDHLSLSWANDEVIDIIYSSEVTIQWCTIEESDPVGHDKGGPHNFGLLSAYPKSGNISIHHNLFAHHKRRLPSLSPYEKGKPGDFRNNVVYNFFEGLGHDGHHPQSGINIVANYYIPGPSSKKIVPFNFSDTGQYFLANNYIDGIGTIQNPSNIGFIDRLWVKVSDTGTLLSEAVAVAHVNTTAAQKAYQQVLSYAGAIPRDRVTQRSIQEVRDKSGSWGRNAPSNPSNDWLLAGLEKEQTEIDSDNDGIPDEWEARLNTDKDNAKDYKTILPSGYSAIEEYLNLEAEKLISTMSR